MELAVKVSWVWWAVRPQGFFLLLCMLVLPFPGPASSLARQVAQRCTCTHLSAQRDPGRGQCHHQHLHTHTESTHINMSNSGGLVMLLLASWSGSKLASMHAYGTLWQLVQIYGPSGSWLSDPQPLHYQAHSSLTQLSSYFRCAVVTHAHKWACLAAHPSLQSLAPRPAGPFDPWPLHTGAGTPISRPATS